LSVNSSEIYGKSRAIGPSPIQNCDFSLVIKKIHQHIKTSHRNEQNTNETSYLDVEEFHTPHALSL
jgi:hypothetical protein